MTRASEIIYVFSGSGIESGNQFSRVVAKLRLVVKQRAFHRRL